jgi:predicted short-subunit dehydrogenase-like oxidoreductase (DUF2520 family)
MNRFSLIGAGRLGTALAFALTRKGWTLETIADRDPAAARESRKIIRRGTATADVRRAAGTRVLLICVPDDSVEAVARLLSRYGGPWSGRCVFHTSGLLPASALDPLRRKGAHAASLHPVQSFPEKRGSARAAFGGIFWGIEGDRQAVGVGRKIANVLGGHSFILNEKAKPLYHAACSLASNAFVSLAATSTALLEAAGIHQKLAARVLLPLVQGTLQNVKKLGLPKALTGPIARGDVQTVRRHLEALRCRPLDEEVYRILGRQALEIASGKGIPPSRVKALRRLLEGKRLPLPAAPRTSRRRVP